MIDPALIESVLSFVAQHTGAVAAVFVTASIAFVAVVFFSVRRMF